jgi:hypothetical protein
MSQNLRTKSSTKESTNKEKEESKKAQNFLNSVEKEESQSKKRAAALKKKYANRLQIKRNGLLARQIQLRENGAEGEGGTEEDIMRRRLGPDAANKEADDKLGCRPDSTNAACILGGMGAGAAFGGVPGACFGAACGLGAAVKRRFTGRGRKSRKKRGRKHKRKTRKHKKKHRRRKSTHKHKKKRKKRRTTKKR